MDEPKSPESKPERLVDAPSHPTRRAAAPSHPTRRAAAPSHPTRRAAALMVGIVVFIVVLSLLGIR